MVNDLMFKSLLEAGYSDQDAREIVALADSRRPKAAPPPDDSLAAIRAAGPPHPLVADLVFLLEALLRGLVAEVNLTPGQHPATAQALDRVADLVFLLEEGRGQTPSDR